MNVLSLFDGISCGQVALNRAGIDYRKYYSSEIDKSAIQVTQKNYPKTIQLGDVTEWECWNVENIDLVFAGSPCQGFSTVGKQLNFDDPRSKLFFNFMDILKDVQPKYWLFENVVMADDVRDAISDMLEVEPIMIDSQLVSAQIRRRYYWSNIPDLDLPRNKNISLESILENDDFKNPASVVGRRLDEHGLRKDYDKSIPLIQCLQVRKNKTKSPCLTTVTKDAVLSNLPHGRYTHAYDNHKSNWRHFTDTERERLQTLPDGYTEIMGKYNREKSIGNGWTVDVIVHLLKGITGEKEGVWI